MKLKKLLSCFALVLTIVCSCIIFSGCEQERLKLTHEFKTEYYINESLDVTNGKMEYTDDDGVKNEVTITADMVDPDSFTTETVGTRELVINYNNYTLKVQYTVMDYPKPVENAVYYAESQLYTNDGYYDYILFDTENGNACYYMTTTMQPTDPNLINTLKVHQRKYTYTEYINNNNHRTREITVQHVRITFSTIDANTITLYANSGGGIFNYNLTRLV